MAVTMYKIKKNILLIIFTLFLPMIMLAQEVNDPYKNIRYIELKNGLKAYILPDKQAINTKIVLEVMVGMDVENTQTAGISHLLEHLIFRDQRIPHNDYLDYIKEQGATNVNGYTGRYKTKYITTIDSKKSYWIVETFAQMLLDKVVTKEDLEIEKRALQVEIGEVQWYHPYTNLLGKTFTKLSNLFPNEENIYEDEFGLQKVKELPSAYSYKQNNNKFTLDEVMHHYDEYYYPKNMMLKVVGNFDANKMELLIKKLFGDNKRTGKKHATEPPYNAKLNNKSYYSYLTGQGDKNYAYIGGKYILNDYKKYLIIDSYTQHLAKKMQQLLRNKLGQTYSVNPFYYSNRDAILTGIVFGSLHQEFENNLELIKQKIQKDYLSMDIDEIEEALDQSTLYYTSLEHDSKTLFKLVEAQEYLHTYHDIYDKTPYEIFSSITTKDFQDEVTKNFSLQNSYLQIYRDYYFFPYDMSIFIFIMLLLTIFTYIKTYKFINLKKGVTLYTKRDIRFTRRLTNRFFLFLKFILIFMLATLLSEWCEFYFYSILFDNPYHSNTIKQPYSYLVYIMSFLLFFTIFIFLNRILFTKTFTRLDVTDKKLNFVGSSLVCIHKDEIHEIKTVSWSIKKFTKTFGLALLFFKPVVMISTIDGRTIYLRSNNALHLEEDLLNWKE